MGATTASNARAVVVGATAISLMLSVACSNNAGNTANARTEHGPEALTVAGVSASSGSATDVPNTGIAVGNGVVVQIANERIAVYDRSLALGSFDGGASTMALNSFVLSTPDGGVSDNTIGPSNVTDPRIVFDTFTQRFFYSANDNAKATPVIPAAVGTIYYGWSPIEGSNSNIFDLGSGWCHGRYRPFKVPGGSDNSYYPVDYGSLGYPDAFNSGGPPSPLRLAFNVFSPGASPTFVSAALAHLKDPLVFGGS